LYSGLKLPCYQSLQLAVVEEEIHIEVVSVELDTLLPRDKGGAGTEFQQEVLEFAQYGVFQIAFDISVRNAEEVEHVRILKDQGRGNLALGA